MPQEIADKILTHFGGFKEALDTIVDLMRSEYPCSVILRGNVGSGKKTLINEAKKITGVQCIHLNPFHITEDNTALKKIATKLGLETKLSNSEIIEAIRKNADKKKKLIIVLHHFEEFCRKRQALLYNLMNLLQTNTLEHDKGPNITLIGLTICLIWIENIEKRVRSRLNAKCVELSLPYRDLDEYVKFASELLNNYKIDQKFREQLAYMYNFSNRSIRHLKNYLISICYRDENGKLMVNFDPEHYKTDYQRNQNVFLKERLKCLTKSQLDLLKIAVCYSFHNGKSELSLRELAEYAQLINWASFYESNPRIIRDASHLIEMGLVSVDKPEQVIGEDSKFYIEVVPKQFRAVIEMDPVLQDYRTDLLVKRIK